MNDLPNTGGSGGPDLPEGGGSALADLLEKLGRTDKAAADVLSILETRIGIHARTLAVLEENIRRTDKRVKKLAARTVSQHEDIETVTSMLEDCFGEIRTLASDVGRLDRRDDHQGRMIAEQRLRIDGLDVRTDTLSRSVLPAPAGPPTPPEPVAAWREWVRLPCDVSEPESLAAVLRWLSMISDPEDHEDIRRCLGWSVALAERETGSTAHPGALDDEDDEETGDAYCVEEVLLDLMWQQEVNWKFVRDYCAAWLRSSCGELG